MTETRRLMTTGDLTAAQQTLVRVMRTCRFGRIENLTVQAGEPLLPDPAVRIVRIVRLGGENCGVKVPGADEFELKQP